MINITDQMMFNLNNLNKENIRINYQMSTGKLLQQGSDDGAVFSKQLYFDDKIRVYEGVQEQIKRAMTLNDSVDSTLANVKLELDVIKTSMLKTLNAGMQQSDKLAVATEIEGIKENFFAWANTNINNEYIFAGSNSTEQPFVKDANGKISYVGDNVLKQVPVEPNSYRDRGVTGYDAFMYTTNTAKVGEPLEFLASE
ncbi:MAG: flagellar hook-associated protein 3, partial [Arcobacteraceae bacterium]|nr:flagellar hook-associated protein 3 [Arcobacteraceae bacterium]